MIINILNQRYHTIILANNFRKSKIFNYVILGVFVSLWLLFVLDFQLKRS